MSRAPSVRPLPNGKAPRSFCDPEKLLPLVAAAVVTEVEEVAAVAGPASDVEVAVSIAFLNLRGFGSR